LSAVPTGKTKTGKVSFMKTLLYRVGTLGAAIISVVFCTGCGEDTAWADVPPNTEAPPPAVVLAEAQPATPPAATGTNLPASPAKPQETNAPTAAPAPMVVKGATVPEHLSLSPALEEVVKMIQGGVKEEVITAYVTNSSEALSLGGEQIVYLNDLGVSSGLMTTLIQHDTSPEILARRPPAETPKAAEAPAALPPGASLTTPAPNVYPGQNLGTASTQQGTQSLPPSYQETVTPTTAPAPAPTEAYQQPVSVNYFYNYLSPYGNWVDVPGYGMCWQPTVGVADPYWRPYYTNGRWLWTDYGWYWYSQYSWGWAPFHYGRWWCHGNLGWIWAPDTCWGPSWVTWRYTPAYCGWAPLPPGCGWSAGIGLTWCGDSVSFGFGFGFGAGWYSWVPYGSFCSPHPYHHHHGHGIVARDHHAALYRDSTVVNNYINGNNNTIINQGIGRDKIAQYAKAEVPKATVRDVPFQGRGTRPEQLVQSGSSMLVSRPQFQKAELAKASARPEFVSRAAARGAGGTPTARLAAPGAAGVERTERPGGVIRSPSPSASRMTPKPTPSTVGAARSSVTPGSPSRGPSVQQTTPKATPSAPSRSPSTAPAGRSRSAVTPSVPEAPAVSRSSVARPATPANPGSTLAPRSSPAPSTVARPQPSVSAPRSSAPSSFTMPARPQSSSPQTFARSEPGRVFPGGSQPSVARPSTPAPQFSRPSFAPTAPSVAPAPRSTYSAPVFSRPSSSAPSFSAPSVSRPAPSAPMMSAPRSSAPSFSAPAPRSAPSGGRGTFRK
jgi:hypothetical protein